MTTWDDVRAGCVVLGHDGLIYGVAAFEPHPAGPVIELVRDGHSIGWAQPPAGTPITVLHWPDTAAEAQAFNALALGGLNPQLIRETFTP